MKKWIIASVMLVAACVRADVIADLEADYIGDQTGWSYLWNPTDVAVGNSAGYESLAGSSDDYQVSAEDGTDNYTNSHNNTLDANTLTGVLGDDTGINYVLGGKDAVSSTDGFDHYFIFGYTVQSGDLTGEATLTFDGNVSGNGSGAEVLVYLNDTLLLTQSGVKNEIDFSDLDLGVLSEDDTVYVALRGVDSADLRNDQRIYISGLTLDVIPEPATIGMLGFGAFGLLALRRRMRA